MSNCVVASGDCGTPLGVVTKQGVEGYNHLTYHCEEYLLAVEPVIFLMTNNWIIETLATRFACANDRFAALLHG